VGNLPLNLTEGDVLCILSQFGEIEDIHLVREKDSGKSKGFAFVKYEDSRSCILAVDNLTDSEVLGRTLRVDHVEKYRLPKHVQDKENEKDATYGPAGKNGKAAGHAYEGQELASSYDIHQGQDLFAPVKEERKASPERPVGGEIVLDEAAQKEERRRRKEARAQKRLEKEEHRRKKEEKKRRKHDRH
jgi:RNA-binding motif X-linked protein 2